SFLALSFDLGGSGPFDVELSIAELLLCSYASGAIDGDDTILHLPFCRAATSAYPLGEVFAIEQNDGVGRRPARRTRIDDPGFSQSRLTLIDRAANQGRASHAQPQQGDSAKRSCQKVHIRFSFLVSRLSFLVLAS